MEYTRTTVISFPNNSDMQDITTGISSGSLNVTEILLNEGINFGELNSNKFEATVYGCQDITGLKIYVYQLDEDDTEYPIFTGYVDSCKLDEYGYYRDIVAYDFFYAKGNMNIAGWWGAFWDIQTESTLGVALRSLLTFAGLSYVNTPLINDSMPITQTQDIQSMKFNDMLSAICQLQLVNPNINREGALEFIDITDTSNAIDITDDYEGGNSSFESYVTNTISNVQIYDKNNNIAGSSGEGTNVYMIQNNLFLYDKTNEELQDLADTIYEKVNTISYKPAILNMIMSDDNITLGKYVNTSKGLCLVCYNELFGSLLVNQTIKSIGNEVLSESKPYDPMAARINAQVEEVSEAVDGASTEYYRIANGSAYIVQNDGSKVIIHRRYITRKSGLVIFHANVIMDIETIDGENYGTVRFVLTVKENEVVSYVPTETYFDGRHTIHLMYVYDCDANITDYLTVTCYAENCKVTIGAFRINGYVCGRGLVGEQVWDGTIEVIEDIGTFPLHELAYTERPTETALISRLTPSHPTASDTVSTFKIKGLTVEAFEEEMHFNEYLSEMTWGEVSELTWGAVADNYNWGS